MNDIDVSLMACLHLTRAWARWGLAFCFLMLEGLCLSLFFASYSSSDFVKPCSVFSCRTCPFSSTQKWKDIACGQCLRWNRCTIVVGFEGWFDSINFLSNHSRASRGCCYSAYLLATAPWINKTPFGNKDVAWSIYRFPITCNYLIPNILVLNVPVGKVSPEAYRWAAQRCVACRAPWYFN